MMLHQEDTMEPENGEMSCEFTRRYAPQIAIQGGIGLVGAFLPGQAARVQGYGNKRERLPIFPSAFRNR